MNIRRGVFLPNGGFPFISCISAFPLNFLTFHLSFFSAFLNFLKKAVEIYPDKGYNIKGSFFELAEIAQ